MYPDTAEYLKSEKAGVLAEFSADGDGKPMVRRYIICAQAGMTDYWEGEKFMAGVVLINAAF